MNFRCSISIVALVGLMIGAGCGPEPVCHDATGRCMELLVSGEGSVFGLRVRLRGSVDGRLVEALSATVMDVTLPARLRVEPLGSLEQQTIDAVQVEGFGLENKQNDARTGGAVHALAWSPVDRTPKYQEVSLAPLATVDSLGTSCVAVDKVATLRLTGSLLDSIERVDTGMAAPPLTTAPACTMGSSECTLSVRALKETEDLVTLWVYNRTGAWTTTNGRPLRVHPGLRAIKFLPVLADRPVSDPPVLVSKNEQDTIRSADINQDGNLDLIVGADDAGQIYTALGRGDGRFGAFTKLEMIKPFRDFLVADLDEDNKADIVSLSYSSSYATFLWGKGDGSFMPRVEQIIPSTQLMIPIAAQFIERGKQDLLFSDYTGSIFSIKNNYLRTNFHAEPHRPAGAIHLYAMDAGDIDGDGRTDAVVASWDAPQLYTISFSNTGMMNSYIQPFKSSTEVDALVMADFNNDGLADTALHDRTGVVVLLNNPNAKSMAERFSNGVTYPIETAASAAIVSADLDCDNRLEIITPYPGMMPGVAILANSGEGIFEPTPIKLPMKSIPQMAISADFDHDGLLDLATVNATDGKVTVTVLLARL